MDRIELDNLTRTYYDAQGETFCALDHAALIWEQGHSIAIMGESGSGKSTLARLMIGLERPSEGRILINGVDASLILRSEDYLAGNSGGLRCCAPYPYHRNF